MKKIWTILVFGIFALSILAPVTMSAEKYNEEATISGKLQDEIDQSQTEWTENLSIPVGRLPFGLNHSIWVAQSFIPTKDVLTRIELFIGKNSTATYPFILGIRDNLTHNDLVNTTVDPEEIPTEELDWIEIDFNNLWVQPGTTYYIVCHTENITDNWYAWGGNNISTSYPNGCAWFSIDDGDTWGNESATHTTPITRKNQQIMPLDNGNITWDMCFITYGIDGTELEVEIQGGLPFATIVIRNVGNISAYDVEWNITIRGGILGLLNKSIVGSFAELPPDDEIRIPLTLLGLGKIEINIQVSAMNVPPWEYTLEGFLILFFLMIQ
jgi:hypothetical protein